MESLFRLEIGTAPRPTGMLVGTVRRRKEKRSEKKRGGATKPTDGFTGTAFPRSEALRARVIIQQAASILILEILYPMKAASKSLVIVESPAKARTIRQFLGADYAIEASKGHVRDLPQGTKELPEKYRKEPWAYLGVNVEKGFEPIYVVTKEKKKQVDKLKSMLKEADQLYLATDEDREGEAISWHLCQILKPKVPVYRLVFHEITKNAILDSLQNPRQINESLVRAQEARRVVDRLYGYDISPLLWRKVGPKLSAGRVQSVAVRLIVERERQRMAFHSATYWDLSGTFRTQKNQALQASLISVSGKRIPTSRDFDTTTGRLKNPDALQYSEEEIHRLLERLEKNTTAEVIRVEKKRFTQRPPAPFTTSTLQQEANRKYGFTARRTMNIAQQLYENGWITYMRTDSTTLSQEAVLASRRLVREHYGQEFLPETPRAYQTKVKNAQEAHEAIRPAGTSFRFPEELHSLLSDEEFKLYDMIWRRTVACQMVDAEGERTSLALLLDDAEFGASGKTITFPGYLRAYIEGRDEGEEGSDGEMLLPLVQKGERTTCEKLQPRLHTTQPPNRYSEAALTRVLEEKGIGRPSTYASIIETILARHYVFKRGNVLIPTWVAFAVCQLMETHFPHLIDYQFTAEMEDDLDAISRGELPWGEYLKEFYFGDGLENAGLKQLLQNQLERIDARQISTVPIGTTADGSPLNVRVGRFGPFLEFGDLRASIPDDLAPDELTIEKGLEMIEHARKGEAPLGYCPETGKPIYLKVGRFGPYIQRGDTEGEEKPQNASLLKGMVPSEVDLQTALQLLSLPRTLGRHPKDGEPVVASNGRYGPYVKWNHETRSLGESASPLEISLSEAVELLAHPKLRSRASRTSVPQPPLKILGPSPNSGENVVLMSGRYGPYVTDKTTNVSLPKSIPSETLTLEQALEMLAAKAAKATKAPSARKKAAKKATTKKATTKKATTKKTTIKKATAKKTTKKSPAKKVDKKTTEKKPAKTAEAAKLPNQ